MQETIATEKKDTAHMLGWRKFFLIVPWRLWLGGAGFLAMAAEAAAAPLPPCSVVWERDARTQEDPRWHSYDFAADAPRPGGGRDAVASYADYYARIDRKNCQKKWTVLIYMAADNDDLPPYALWDIYEMEAGFSGRSKRTGSTERVDVLVHLDTKQNAAARRLHIFQAPTLYDRRRSLDFFTTYREEWVQSPVAEVRGERLAPETELAEFLAWGNDNYPAEHVMVVVWGHGQGWTARRGTVHRDRQDPRERVDASEPGGGEPAPPSEHLPNWHAELERVFVEQERRAAVAAGAGVTNHGAPAVGFGGMAFDDSNGKYLDTPALARTLRKTVLVHRGGRPLDIYASDACLMQNLEVATQVAPFADFIVGSAQVQSFLGMPYRDLLVAMNAGDFGQTWVSLTEDTEPFLLARYMPVLMRRSLEEGGSQVLHDREGAGAHITVSALSSSELLHTLIPSLNEFSHAVLAYMAENRTRPIQIAVLAQTAFGFQGGAKELAVFMNLLRDRFAGTSEKREQLGPLGQRLVATIDQTLRALQQTVVNHQVGSAYGEVEQALYLLGVRAVSAWIPGDREEFQSRIDDFRKSRFYSLFDRIPGDEKRSVWEEWLRVVFVGRQ